MGHLEVETWDSEETRGVFSSFQALNDRLGNAQQPTGLGLLVGILSFEKPFFSRYTFVVGDMGGPLKINGISRDEILCILVGAP